MEAVKTTTLLRGLFLAYGSITDTTVRANKQLSRSDTRRHADTSCFDPLDMGPIEPFSKGLVQNLTYGSLISTRSRRSRWPIVVESDAVLIDEKHGAIMSHLLVLHHDHVEIVQHEPISVEPC